MFRNFINSGTNQQRFLEYHANKPFPKKLPEENEYNETAKANLEKLTYYIKNLEQRQNVLLNQISHLSNQMESLVGINEKLYSDNIELSDQNIKLAKVMEHIFVESDKVEENKDNVKILPKRHNVLENLANELKSTLASTSNATYYASISLLSICIVLIFIILIILGTKK